MRNPHENPPDTSMRGATASAPLRRGLAAIFVGSDVCWGGAGGPANWQPAVVNEHGSYGRCPGPQA